VNTRPSIYRPGRVTAVAAMMLAMMLAMTVLTLLPQLAHACPVCGGGNPANRFAFFASTISLSVIPLGLFAAGFLWLRKRIFTHTPDEFREREADKAGEIRPPVDR
jgi:hypothetical protein